MDAAITDEEFRAQVRAWLDANLPADMVRRSRTAVHPSREDMLGVTAVLARAGWSVPHWPVEHGGPGWSARRRHLFEEELTLAGGSANNIQGVSLVGPVLYTYGTAAQKARYLAPIREGREFWAQGFSEPNAGSDLASLRTRAVRDGDHYVVDGQKIWTSQAMYADMLFCLVRTDPAAKPQKGISFLLIPMNSPGVTVRPIASIDEGESLCEVFLDSVRVPVGQLVGEEGKGWDYAKFLLGNERVQTAEVPRNKLYLERLKAIARQAVRDDRPLIEDPVFRHRMAQAEIDLIGLEAAVAEAIDRADASPLTPSALKVIGCELMQRTLGLQVEALGPYGAVFHPHCNQGEQFAVPGPAYAAGVTAEFLFRRAATIYGGSSEIQKNIIAKLLFAGDEGSAAPLEGEQALLRESAERFARRERLARRPHPAPAGAADAGRAAWQRLAEAGFAALALPEAMGGAGGGAADLAVVCEAFGTELLDAPYVGLATLAGQTLAGLDAAAPRVAELGAALAAGAPAVALALEDPPGVRTVARRDGGGFVLDGSKCMVHGADFAHRLLVCARLEGDGPALFVVDTTAPGLHRRALRTVDGRGAAELAFEHVVLPAGARIAAGDPAGDAIARGLDHALVMACAESVGAMGQALRITRDYLGVRRQFGSTLSEFQALRHRLAEMYAELATSRALVRRAAAALGDAPARRARTAAACKARVGRAAMFVANQSVQLHGGIGMTEECAIGQYYKRLFALESSLGNAERHTRRYAAGL